MKYKLFYSSVYLYNTLLFISSTDDDKKLPRFDGSGQDFVHNENAAFLSTGNMAEDLTLPVRVLVGNKPPEKTKKLHEFEIETKNKKIYIGDVRKESYMIVGLSTKKNHIVVNVDSKDNVTLIYIYIPGAEIELVTLVSGLYDDSNVQEEINELGKKDGCHVCGDRKAAKYIPHLMPPIELDTTSERSWYPVCETDYRAHQNALAQKMLSLT